MAYLVVGCKILFCTALVVTIIGALGSSVLAVWKAFTETNLLLGFLAMLILGGLWLFGICEIWRHWLVDYDDGSDP